MWATIQGWIKTYEKPLGVLVGALCLTGFLMNLDFNFLEANLYDLRVTRGFHTQADPNIVLIGLDDKTIKEIDEFAPLSLTSHTRFIQQMAAYQPKGIGYLIDMSHVSQTNDSYEAKQFVESARKMMSNGISFLLGTSFDVTGEVIPPSPLDSIPHSVALIHKDGNVFAEDKVTRRAILSLYDRPTFHLEFAQKLGILGPKNLPRGHFYVPQVDGRYFFFRYHDPTKSYPIYSFVDVLNKKIPAQALKNKIVLVGTMSSDDSTDFAFTPYSKTPFSNPKLLIHANILDSILHQDGIKRIPSSVNALITFVITSTVLWWIITSTPLYSVFATVGLGLCFIFVSQLLFQLKGLWIRESQALVGLFVSYYLAVPYRLIREYKKRWDYQKKNELLIQVEELKTNFLSLITHDLKTPVARVQGLTEVLIRSANDRLSQQDKVTLKHILASTDELNHFITSILELNRVETNPIQLKIESKDINQLIERSLEGFSALARAKNINLRSNLEPLFPIRVDPSLISKILNNLIDNAIKYSPSNSEVYVESKEEDQWVVVSVQDQGIGMSVEEQQNLFTRFYRAKNDTTTTIAGTGLGLYLTKYFVEAHKGRVEVQSIQGKGSTFKIYLPIPNISSHIQDRIQSTQRLWSAIRLFKPRENSDV